MLVTLVTRAPSGQAQRPAGRTVGNTGFIQLQSPQLCAAHAAAEAAGLLADAGVHRDRPDHLRPALDLRAAREAPDRGGHGAPRRHAGRGRLAKIREYALLFWANRGNHNETTAQKFLPSFTAEELQDAALKAQAAGAFASASGDLPPLATADAVKKELADLQKPIFDPAFEPMTTAKTPPAGQDILQASANTFYQGVSLADMKGVQERYPLNSRVVKDAKGIREEVYRAGTPDGKVPPGLYATYLKKANEFLAKAQDVRRSGAGHRHRGAHPLLPDRRSERLAAVRRRLGQERRDGRFRQRLHRGLSRRARREGHVAELRDGHRQARDERDGEPGEERRLLRGQGAVGRQVQEARLHAAGRQGGGGAHRDRRLPRHRPSATTCRTSRRSTRSTARRTSSSSAAATRSTPRDRRSTSSARRRKRSRVRRNTARKPRTC